MQVADRFRAGSPCREAQILPHALTQIIKTPRGGARRLYYLRRLAVVADQHRPGGVVGAEFIEIIDLQQLG